MLIVVFLLILGLFLTVFGAEFFIRGASALAQRFGISPLIIGLSIVAFGTSLPEFGINLISTTEATNIGIGNVIGATIANLGLIVGVAAMIQTLKIRSEIIYHQIPLLFVGVVVIVLLGADKVFLAGPAENIISRGDGLILILLFSIFVLFLFRKVIVDYHRGHYIHIQHLLKIGRTHGLIELLKTEHSLIKSILFLIGGLISLLAGADLTVLNGELLARSLGVSDLLIGLTVVSLGTTLPEFVASIVAVSKNQTDIAVGNVVGSSIFNLIFVLGVAAMLQPINFSGKIFIDLFFVLLILTRLLIAAITDRQLIKRWEGASLLLFYLIYIIFVAIRG